jgi:nicotinate-nucleotide adenylyltransferase
MKKIGIFGGTFDPVHIGHVRTVIEVLERMGLDKILVVPSGLAPHKIKNPPLQGVSPRLRGLQKAFQGLRGIRIWTGEIRKKGPTYTIDTVREIKKSLGLKNKYFLIIGSDWIKNFSSWKESKNLLNEVSLVICPRKTGPRPLFLPQGSIWLRIPVLDVSSTEIREKIKKGLEVKSLVP